MHKEKKRLLLLRTTNNKDIIPPIGLLYIAAVVRKYCTSFEWNIKIIDFIADRLNQDSLTETFLEYSPNVIGISSLISELPFFKKVCVLIRKTNPESALIAGGPLPSNHYDLLLKNKWVDFVVIGEGESTIIELLDVICKNKKSKSLSLVKGIAYNKNGKVVLTPPRELIPNLDAIPLPAWDLINLKKYRRFPNWNGPLKAKYYAPIITSRGCVYNCVYCHNLFGKKVRKRSVEDVLSEIEMLYRAYRVKEFHIIDDYFNFDLDRVKKICKRIVDKKMKLNLSFPNGLRTDNMDRDTLVWLKRAGTYKINYAIETTNPRLQKFIKKNLDIKKAKEVIEETSKLGILAFGFFMLGFPTETEEEMRQTISFAVDSKLDTAKFLKVTPFKNTTLAELVRNKPFLHLHDEDRCNNTDPFYNENLNCSDLPLNVFNDIFLEAHRKFYVKPSRILRIFFRYKNFKILWSLFLMYMFVWQRKQDNNVSINIM